MSAPLPHLEVLAFGSSHGRDPARLSAQPEFRKASRPMRLAYLAVAEALAQLFDGGIGRPEDRAALALVVGSLYGELETTTDFLVTLERSGMARPVLFQSSLHNATTGFLALQLGITGPSVTVSHRDLTAAATLETACLLLEESESELCLAVTVDAAFPALRSHTPPDLAEAIVLARPGAARARGLAERGRIAAGGPHTPHSFGRRLGLTP